jgi:hypothetical protein
MVILERGMQGWGKRGENGAKGKEKVYFGRVVRGEKYWRKGGQGKGMEEVEGEWKYWRGECKVLEKDEKIEGEGKGEGILGVRKGEGNIEEGAMERDRGSWRGMEILERGMQGSGSLITKRFLV